MPQIDPIAIGSAYTDLALEAAMLKQVNIGLALFAYEAKANTWKASSEKLRKEGLLDKVLEEVKRIEQLKKDGDPQAFSAYLTNLSSKVQHGDKAALYVYNDVLLPSAMESKTIAFTRQMSLVYLVAKFENFLERMLSLMLSVTPAVMKDRTISLAELLSIPTIDDARKAVSEKVAKDVMYEGIDKLAAYLSGHWGICLDDYGRWDLFTERFYRRNIIIHNSGLPNQLYREKTKYHGPDKALVVDQQYITDSINIFNEVAEKLMKSMMLRFVARVEPSTE